jgi:replication factor A2
VGIRGDPADGLYSRQDKYVAILGSMKKFGGKIHVSATSIRPITDHNEVYNHLLKALYVSLSLRNPGGGGVANVGAGAGAGVSSDYKAGAAGNGGGVDHSAWASLPPLQRKIMEVVSAETDEDGIHVSLVSRQVGNADGQQVM